MSTVLTIYHNPQCTKSRNALKLLEENKDKHNYQVQIVQYKKEPLNRQQLETLVDYLGLNEDNFSVLLRPEVQKSVSSLNEAIELILHEPQQLERPFVIDAQHKKAALGRPDLSGIEALIANL